MISPEAVEMAAEPQVRDAYTDKQHISDMLLQQRDARIYPADRSQELHEAVQQWKSEGATVVFTTGVYDLLHLDHQGYLIETKALASSRHLRNSTGQKLETYTSEEQREIIENYLGSGALKLIVSVDGNSWVSQRKGFQPDKGSGPRPILDWRTRAREIAGIAIGFDFTEGMLPVADAVTIHDKVEYIGTPHEDTLDLAEHLQPHVWSLYYESEDIIEAVGNRPALTSTDIYCIGPGHYASDQLLGGKFSTTKIVQRATGTQ